MGVLRFVSKTIATIAICSVIGLQWFGLQSVAWTTMMFSNARHVSFCEAVKRTFDGAHPCALCKQISKAKGTEKKENQSITAKGDLICVVRQFALLPPFRPVVYSELKSFLIGNPQQPPAPPPRAEFA